MLFDIIASDKTECAFKDEILMAAIYFTNHLIIVSKESLQERFRKLFISDEESQNFFNQTYNYINYYFRQTKRGLLEDYYKTHKWPDELARKCFVIDKNIEKQILIMWRLLCSNGNVWMANFFRKQDSNNISRPKNIIWLIADRIGDLTN